MDEAYIKALETVAYELEVLVHVLGKSDQTKWAREALKPIREMKPEILPKAN